MNANRKAFQAKIEGAYGVDPTPDPATDALQAVNFAWSGPAKVVADELKYAANWYGARDKFVISETRECTFELPVIGGGTPLGTNLVAPLLALYRSCGLAAVLSAGVSVVFSPVNSAEESAMLRVTEDRFLRKLLGARGNVRLAWAEGKVPRAYFTMMGLYSTPGDEAMPAVTLPTLQKPVGMTKSNTVVTLGGTALKCSSAEIDAGRTWQYRNYAGVEEVAPVDALPTATLEFELPLTTVKNVYQDLETAAVQALSIAHGQVPGNIVTAAGARAQLTDLSEKEKDGQIFTTAKYELLPGLTGAAPFTLTLT